MRQLKTQAAAQRAAQRAEERAVQSCRTASRARRCEDLKLTLWPEIKAAHEEITNMFEEERMETYELSQQAQMTAKLRELFAASCRSTCPDSLMDSKVNSRTAE